MDGNYVEMILLNKGNIAIYSSLNIIQRQLFYTFYGFPPYIVHSFHSNYSNEQHWSRAAVSGRRSGGV